jgi:hypothetical protein
MFGRVLPPLNGELKFLGKFGGGLVGGRGFSSRGFGSRDLSGGNNISSDSGLISSSRNSLLRTSGAASEKESTSTNSFSESDGQFLRKLNRGQKQTPFRLSTSSKASSSKAEGTRRTPTEETFLTAFFSFFRLISARPEAA